MNYMESVRYLKKYPPDVLGSVWKYIKGMPKPNMGTHLPALSGEMGMSLEAMSKNKTLDPILRGEAVKYIGELKKIENAEIYRNALSQRLKNKSKGDFAGMFPNAYAGSYGEE